MTTMNPTGHTSTVQRVDAQGVHFSELVERPLSITFDGQRVWSFVVGRDGAPNKGGWLVSWPVSLQRLLDGLSEVAVIELDGRELFRRELQFGTADARIRVVDSSGAPVAIDKTGRLGRQFSVADESSITWLMDGLVSALNTLNDDIGVPGFLTFGALLGAVRDGHLIGHDNDADISYLAAGSHPFDIISESYRIERRFRELGWKSTRMSGADFKLLMPWPGGGLMGIDVFTAFYVDDDLYVMPNVRAKLPRSAILPLSTVQLEGRAVAAPANPEPLLEATYGSGWRVPDPSFHFHTPRVTSRRLTGWMRGERRNARNWEDFYRQRRGDVPREPSSFALWVRAREPEPGLLVDVGAGTGRDAFWFARQGFDVLATDISATALRHISGKAARRSLSVEARHNNVYDLRDVLTLGTELANVRRPAAIYARFLLHAVAADGRRNLWRLARMALAGGDGTLYLEFRAQVPAAYHFAGRTRYTADPDKVIAELEEYGFMVVERQQSSGLAVLGGEDPVICRIAAEIKSSAEMTDDGEARG
jgi:SAM-dependent methyltransferase